LTQRKLIKKGRRRFILAPRQNYETFRDAHEDDNWYYSDRTGEVLLKDHALAELRQKIRRDKKEDYDLMFPWFSLIIGAIGAATGFVAVWFR